MTNMCTHLVQAGTTDTPMTLVHTDTATAFVCPSCCGNYCIALLDAGTPAAHVLETISLSHCEHSTGTCFACLESLKDELSKRWMRYRLAGDKPASNRLGRLRKAIRKRYDTSESKPLPAYRNANILGTAGERGRAGQRWQGLRAQRLSTLRPPPANVVVVPAPVTTN
jgi:hypothetical protein